MKLDDIDCVVLGLAALFGLVLVAGLYAIDVWLERRAHKRRRP